MRIFLFILGGVLVLMGAVWLLQGLNVLTGSAMSGHRLWVAVGSVCVVAGVVLEVVGARWRRKG
jgi:uncharacterized membrane protein HdeD (DUF308 family)